MNKDKLGKALAAGAGAAAAAAVAATTVAATKKMRRQQEEEIENAVQNRDYGDKRHCEPGRRRLSGARC